jgi:hypothetical protein
MPLEVAIVGADGTVIDAATRDHRGLTRELP